MKHQTCMRKILILLISFSVLVACTNTNPDMDLAETVTAPIENNENDDTDGVDAPVEPIETVTTPIPGGTLSFSILNPVSLDPLTNRVKSIDQVIRCLYEPLFQTNIDGQITPVLVESYQFSHLTGEMQLTLKSDIAFHDGTLLQASDVKYTLDAMRGSEGLYQERASHIRLVTVVSETELILYFNEPYAFYLYDLDIPIVSEAYHRSADFNPLVPIGSGPFQHERLVAMHAYNMVAFDGYHGTLPYVDSLSCPIVRDETVALNTFEQNLTQLYVPEKLDWRTFAYTHIHAYTYTGHYMDFIGFNLDSPVLLDKHIRRAIAYGIDREALLATFYLGHGVVQDSLIHPDYYLLDRETNPSVVHGYQPKTARHLFETAGLRDLNSDGLFESPKVGLGQNLTLTLLVHEDNAIRLGMAQEIQEQLKDVGLLIEILAVSQEAFDDAILERAYDLVLTGWKMPVKPDYTVLFHSGKAHLGYNLVQLQDTTMNLALERVYQSQTEADLSEHLAQLDRVFQDTLPYLVLAYPDSAVLAHSTVQGQLSPYTDRVFNGIQDIFMIPRN